MATTLYLLSANASTGGIGHLKMDTVRGAASVNAITNATAAGTNIPVTSTAGGQAIVWFSEPIAAQIAISAAVTVNIRGLESANTVNAGRGILIEQADMFGNVLSSIVADTTVPATIAEYTTADAANGAATFTPTATSLRVGDRIKVTLKVRNVGTMAAGTVTNSYNGPTAAAAGDTFISFTENFSLMSSFGLPYPYYGDNMYYPTY